MLSAKWRLFCLGLNVLSSSMRPQNDEDTQEKGYFLSILLVPYIIAIYSRHSPIDKCIWIGFIYRLMKYLYCVIINVYNVINYHSAFFAQYHTRSD